MIAPVRSEWLKIRATLSPKICALLALAFGIGFPVLIGVAIRTADEADIEGTDSSGIIAGGVSPAMVTLMVMVVIAVAAEYRFGIIRVTFAATPRRLRFMAAKLGVLTAIAVAVGALIGPLALLLANPLLDGGPLDTVALDDPGVVRMLVGIPLMLGVAALIAGAVAFIVRSPAAGIAIVVVWAIVIEPILTAVPWVREHVGPYVPFNALGQVLRTGGGGQDDLAPWTGFALGCAWAVALLALAAVLLQRRDA